MNGSVSMIGRWIKKIGVSGTLLLMAALLGGCGIFSDSDPISLMRKPLLPEEAQKLSGVVTKQLAGREPIRPRDPADTTSIRIEDLNNDGTKEAVLFYETPEDENVRIRGMLLENQGGTWVKKLTFDGAGLVLESFKLVDVTNDGTIDIVAGFSRGEDDAMKYLVVYSYTGGTLEKVWETPYTYFAVDQPDGRGADHKPLDMNGDGLTDITIVSLLKNEYYNVTTYQYNDGFKELGKVDLDNQANYVLRASAGQVAENKTGLILDTFVGQGSTVSNIITMENGQLIRADIEDQTFKDAYILSEDVDRDGILEFGKLETPAGWEDASPGERPQLISFYQWDGKKGSTFKMQQYRDWQSRYYINIPPELHGQVTIDRKSDLEKHITFIMKDTGEVLAEIKFFSLTAWEENGSEWQELVRTSEQVIGLKRSDKFKTGKDIRTLMKNNSIGKEGQK